MQLPLPVMVTMRPAAASGGAVNVDPGQGGAAGTGWLKYDKQL